MSPPMLELSAERRARELCRAEEVAAGQQEYERAGRQVFLQCIALSFAGVPFYGLAFYFADPDRAQLAVALSFVVSYGLPFFRWLHFHVRRSEAFG